MSDFHRIALRDHWVRTELPTGEVQFTRRFGNTANPSLNAQLWLVLDSTTSPSAVFVNGVQVVPLGADKPEQFEITQHVKARNEVTIQLPAGAELRAVFVEFREV